MESQADQVAAACRARANARASGAIGSCFWRARRRKIVVRLNLPGSRSGVNSSQRRGMETVAAGKRPCSGLAIGFGSLWVPTCGDQTTAQSIARVDLKSGKVTATVETTVSHSEGGIAIGIRDGRGTALRIDPGDDRGAGFGIEKVAFQEERELRARHALNARLGTEARDHRL